MTELMKRYEAETGKKAYGMLIEYASEAYTKWLESQVLGGKTLEKFQEIIRNQCDEISELKAQLTWRPVTQKPKEGQIVFAMIPTGWVVAQYWNGEFYVDDEFIISDAIGEVSHWLPIPPSPDEDKK